MSINKKAYQLALDEAYSVAHFDQERNNYILEGSVKIGEAVGVAVLTYLNATKTQFKNLEKLNTSSERVQELNISEQPVVLCEADSYNLGCKITGMGVSHEILKINFPDPEVRSKVIWVVQMLQLNAMKAMERESTQPAECTILPSGNNQSKNNENEQNITEREESNGLPERDKTKTAGDQGVFRKFEVRRTDGSDRLGGKHYGCEYFVLDVEHDPHAKAALNAYVLSCQLSHPPLAKDMAARYGLKPYDRIDSLAEALKEIDELKASKREIIIERKMLEFERALLNEAAKPPYAHLFAMTDLGNMLFKALEAAGCKPLFRAITEEKPIPFLGIEINVATLIEVGE